MRHERCPSWCACRHDDAPEECRHLSEPSIVPVIASTRPTGPITASLEAIDLSVRLGRQIGELVDWVSIEPLELAGHRLVLTRESTRLLAQHLTALLDEGANA